MHFCLFSPELLGLSDRNEKCSEMSFNEGFIRLERIQESNESSKELMDDLFSWYKEILAANGQTYLSEPEQLINPDVYEDYKLGEQIGKTKEGIRIYELEMPRNV